MSRCCRACFTDGDRSCSGEMITSDACPRMIRSRASLRSGIESRLLMLTALVMPCLSSPASWSAIRATSGEITTVRALVLS